MSITVGVVVLEQLIMLRPTPQVLGNILADTKIYNVYANSHLTVCSQISSNREVRLAF